MSETPNDGNIRDQVEKMMKKRGPPEHMRVLFECTKESFYQRGLPLAGILGISTYAAIKKGYLKPAKRLGVFPKVSLAVILGLVIGRVSYRNVCMERLKALPGSDKDCFTKKFNRDKISPLDSSAEKNNEEISNGKTEDTIPELK